MNDQPHHKVSPRLRAKLSDAKSDSNVEVVIQLTPPKLRSAGSRGERAAAAKEQFEREVASMRDRISSAGGEVIDTAWINSTVRSRIRAEHVEDLAADDRVVALDVPVPLEPEE